MLIEWSEEAASHIRSRSCRHRDAVDIESEWTQEATDDPDALWFEPDPKSASGLGIRIIGYSVSAGFVVTVIGYHDHRRLRGATAYKSGGSDLRAYREGL
ncbi:MAG TPA: hypothetical protein VG317_08040 [Pseudonocardiaceae bacterium]|nr:hypothetical protein [Pseudonocardiaceae bacterium]